MKNKVEKLSQAIRVLVKKINRPIKLMEVCGTHTVAIFRHGIRSLLPEGITLLSGPGCPVCVTSIQDVDTAIELTRQPSVVLATFGDMMRVPGGEVSLYEARAEGAEVQVVYSPLDALKLAHDDKGRKVVFFATGFETTSPLVAATLLSAEKEGIENFFVYPVHKLVPPALKALLDSGETNVDGLILPGHVSTIIGTRPYEFLVSDFRVPSVITGFGPDDILEAILIMLNQIATDTPSVQIQYGKVVRKEGNPRAREVIAECFKPEEARWRGIGVIPESGLGLKERFRHRDVREVVNLPRIPDRPEPKGCSCGEVLRGIKAPTDCRLFGKTCTPEKPVGACMVSTEGSCAAYHRYGNFHVER